MSAEELKALLNVRDAAELTADEARQYLEADDNDRYLLNNYLCNDLLEALYKDPKVKPSDAVDVALMALTKIAIGSAKNHAAAEVAMNLIIDRFVGLMRSNIHQIGVASAMYDPKRKSQP